MKKIALGLCAGRHEIPVENYIFSEIPTERIFDFAWQEGMARSILVDKEVDELVLYVTGLTVASFSVMNVCKELGVKLTLMHYNRDSGEYVSQAIK